MNREIVAPLGIGRTALEGTPGTENDHDSVPYYFRSEQDGDSESRTDPAADYACFFGAGGFLSTPSDLVRLGSAWLEPKLLKAETLALFQTPVRLVSGTSSGFALGWKVDTIPFAGGQTRAVRHRAGLIGGEVSFTLFPDRGLVIAATSNTRSSRVDSFALRVAELFASVR